MRIAPALLLTALGGILADAVTLDVPGIDLNALGTVLFFVGLLWLAVEVFVALAPARRRRAPRPAPPPARRDRKSTRLNSSHTVISYAVFCLKKKSRRRAL